MKLVVLSDIHANLPALQAVIKKIKIEGYDQIFHLGDAISIGPYPSECLDLLLSLRNIRCIMGNHDDWYAHGLPDPRPEWMSDGEIVHQLWTHEQLGDQYRSLISNWPWQINISLDGITLSFLHYALSEDGKTFKHVLDDPTPEDMDHLFKPHCSLQFFGHTHKVCDLQGRAHYLSPGSLGCQKVAVATYFVIEIQNGKTNIKLHEIVYDDQPLFDNFEARQVPERSFIYNAFFGNRFS